MRTSQQKVSRLLSRPMISPRNHSGRLLDAGLASHDARLAYEARMPPHGTYSRYHDYDKCRCPECQRANADYMRGWYKRQRENSAGITDEAEMALYVDEEIEEAWQQRQESELADD